MSVWIGPGVFTLKGKDYGYGDTLPKDLDKKAEASLIKKGKVAKATPEAPAAPDVVAGLKVIVAGLKSENEALKAQISELTENIEALTVVGAAAKPAAAPAKGKK